MTLTPSTRLGPYEILSPIGAGGMGEVYKARDTRLDRDVAVKVIHPHLAADPQRFARFEQEARAAARLDHPNILVVHDIGTHDGSPYLVTELLEGESLRAKLGGPLPPRTAVDYLVQAARGLAAAHAHGIVHRDVKPENLFVTKDGRIKLLDFGIAKLRPSAAPDTESPTEAATQPGLVVGTVAYMAPEQIRGEPVDARADVFSLGIVFHEMLAGRHPFARETGAETMTAILREEPADLASTAPPIPLVLEKIVCHCLEKDPSVRMQSARDVVFALETLSDLARAEPAGRPTPVATGWFRRHWAVLAGSVLVVAILAIVAVFAPRLLRPIPTAPIVGGTPSVLALPCKVFGAPEVAFLTDAVPQTMSTLLAQVEGLDTKAPPTSLEVEKVKGDLARLAELYRVSSFIVTSITTAPGRYALNVQLIDATTRKVRWGQQYAGPRDDYNDLARQAAEGIRLAVRPAASRVPAVTVSSEAELAFREGTFFSNRYNNRHDQSDFDLALAAFQRAFALAPGLADAAGEIAMLYVYRFESGTMPARETTPAVERWASRALAISSCSVSGLEASSAVELQRPVQSTRRIVEYGLKAASCGPAAGRAHFALAYGADVGGLTSVAIAAYLEAHRLDPLYAYAPYNAATWLSELGRPDEALRLVDVVLTTEPDMVLALVQRIVTLIDLGRLAEAEASLKPLEARAEKDPQVGMMTPFVRCVLSLAAGDRRAADAALTRVFTLIRGEQGTGLLLSFATGYVVPYLARRGRVAEAVHILERGAAVGAVIPYEFLMRNRDLASARGDPRLAGILARSKLQFDETRRTFEQARARGELPTYLHKPLDGLAQFLKENKDRH